MSNCPTYIADKVFKNFKVIELPICMVGLSTTRDLNVGVDLNYSAYLKTTYDGVLMKYEEAQEISAGHRAFNIQQIDKDTIKITFKPSNECISKAKHEKQFENRFVIDLRLIQIDDIYCCDDERHLECGRFYLSGQFEYCNITHSPKIINFGEVKVNTKVPLYIDIYNNSKYVSTQLEYLRTTGYHLYPSSFTISPKSSVKIEIIAKPVSLNIANIIVFNIYNYHGHEGKNMEHTPNNCLTHQIKIKIKVLLNIVKRKEVVIESLHKLIEPIPCCTYVGEEIAIHNERKRIAKEHLQFCKSKHKKKVVLEKLCTGNVKCYSNANEPNINVNFCENYKGSVITFDVPKISVSPFLINFGKVAITTYAESVITLMNDTKFDITIYLMNDPTICYTKDKLQDIFVKLKPFSSTEIVINCLGVKHGPFFGTFQYSINHKFFRNQPYTLHVNDPCLYLTENNLKFGMVSSDSFITSVPIRIGNDYNVSVSFRWGELLQDAPFEIVPEAGTIPKHSSIMCDVRYVCKPTKTKTHEVEFFSLGETIHSVLVELNIITRKISIRFLQSTLQFREIPLNIEKVENARLENSSREIATFHVVEPLIPGITMHPMNGTIGPKMIQTFKVTAKIACVLEFSFEIFVKINNKENVVLTVSGNVLEPKISIVPKSLSMPRVPCNMITYVPISLQNSGDVKATVEILDTGDEDIFDVYATNGSEKCRIHNLILEGGETKTVFVKIHDYYRREYEQFVPFKINGLLGPPDILNPLTTELQYYTGSIMELYENNTKVKLKSILKDISCCRLTGVITVPWIQLSTNKFEIIYDDQSDNSISFTMKNISRYCLYVTIMVGKLGPHFSLQLQSEDKRSVVDSKNDSITFEFDKLEVAEFLLRFHPKIHGKFVVDALLYLDKQLSVPFYNLSFVGKRELPVMEPSVHSIVFPPCCVYSVLLREFQLTIKTETDKEHFSYHCNDEDGKTSIEFIDCENNIRNEEEPITVLNVRLTINCTKSISKIIFAYFYHDGGSYCDVQIIYCSTYCPLTLHASSVGNSVNSPFPYYPLPSHADLYNYMEKSKDFLEKWMYQQGFRRDLYPIIPDSFHATSEVLQNMIKNKGINVTYMNFIKRMAGPLVKHLKKINTRVHVNDDPVKQAKDTHDNYSEILALMHSRGANLMHVQAKYLLSYRQFLVHIKQTTPKSNAEFIIAQQLIRDEELYIRLNTQCWLDFILQSYKVFILDSCFFECVCVSNEPRNITQILINWYNEQIASQHSKLRPNAKEKKVITNLTTDLTDGIAIISALLSHCPFLESHFISYIEITNDSQEGDLINNACIIIEALNILRLFFPISTAEIMQPNFLQMLFLSVHLYVVLPMFQPREIIIFSPPLLRSSTRYLSVAPVYQESLVFNFFIIDNNKNTFFVEKGTTESGKKMSINVKYNAFFVEEDKATLIVHGYNKTRIFDTYVVFILKGKVGSLSPYRKYKVTGPLYRQCRVDIMVSSPFSAPSTYKLVIKDVEPTIPADVQDDIKPKFYLRRLYFTDEEVILTGMPKDFGSDIVEHKVYFQLICLTAQIGNSWIWFRSSVGEFFVRVTTQPRLDLAIDSLQAHIDTWPLKPCSCGDICECYRTMALSIPHRNELKVKALRNALQEMASDIMLKTFDELIDTETGKIIIYKLLAEGGTMMSEVNHILRREMTYRVTARSLIVRNDKVTLHQHSDQILLLPITIPITDKAEKFSVTLTSECGADIRTYKVLICSNEENFENSYSYTYSSTGFS